MKKQFLFVLLLLLPVLLHAQKDGQDLADSLLKEISNAKDDINKVKMESKLAFLYANINPDEGIKYGLQALELAKQLKYERGTEDIYGALGVIYSQKSDFPKGLEYFFLALKMAEEKGDKNDIQLRLFNISSAYFNIGDHDKALEYCNKSLKICEELKDTLSIASNFSNLGAIYSEKGDPQKALEYNFKALNIFEKYKEKLMTAGALEHICASYVDQHNYEKAIEYSDKALKLYEELGNKHDLILNFMDMATLYMGMARDTSNKNYHVNDKKYNEKYLQKAIEYIGKSQAIGKENGDLVELIEADKNLSAAYELSGNYKEALNSYKEYAALKDSVFSNDNKVKLAKLETKRETQLKDKLVQINKLEQIFFAVGLGLLLIVILVVARNFMIQKKANKVKSELLAQKDILMKEIHHRVKNNLQVISTLLDLQLTNITDEQAKDAMTESTTRVRSISLIHQQLYQNENITSIEFSKFAKDLMQQVTAVFKKAGPPVILKSDMPETVLDIDTAVPLGLILNELMTNSYKYAFDSASNGKMEIVLQQKNGQYELLYKDSGPGLPEGLDVSKLKSLGIKVMRGLSKQIGGTFSYVAEDKTFVVTFKDVAGRKLTD